MPDVPNEVAASCEPTAAGSRRRRRAPSALPANGVANNHFHIAAIISFIYANVGSRSYGWAVL
ncbi:hypothetical protein KM540_gp152 [Western grey kangaroopox virus]|uniref:Uncharacterized protein n=1 Tax=Western grey kangaroopox virus TaxID=1566307 RepID=A0A2C9DSV0_9POXV|nr:hypothetical protein KM540_gp152 [Western grey kangaroopox virus]ATI21083.1 hypothetical protein [Western grey kangaroopox virus]